MGCIGEQMIHETLLKEKLNIIGECNIATVGMIVEGLLGSRAFCPDAVGKLPDDLLFPIEYNVFASAPLTFLTSNEFNSSSVKSKTISFSAQTEDINKK